MFPVNSPSKRKPYNHLAGYVASRRNKVNGAYAVLYRAKEQGIDPSDGPWATVCELHNTICNHRTLALARGHLPLVEWCEACQAARLWHSSSPPAPTSSY
jgi:hypothetical protein